MYDLLIHINNTLLITNEINDKYNNDSILAKDELLIRFYYKYNILCLKIIIIRLPDQIIILTGTEDCLRD